jgi:hypothetical protein
MATYTCLEELEGCTLAVGDTVIFPGSMFVGKEIDTYTVHSTHLSHIHGANSSIFRRLGLDKYRFCSEAYGYYVHTGAWPSFMSRDYEAATRVVLALYRVLQPQPLQRIENWVAEVREEAARAAPN